MKTTTRAILGSLLIGTLVVGCSSTSADSGSTDASGDGGTESSAGQPSELTVMASQGWIKDAELALAEQYEEETGIHIDYQIIPADQYFNVLKTKLNSGEGTDIFGGQSGKSDLTLQYDVETNAVPLTDMEWTSRNDPNALDQCSLDGVVYCQEIWDIIAGNYFIVVYNKEIFADLGIEVPTTFDQFTAAADTIMASGVTPIFEPISDGWHHVLWFPMNGPRFEQLNPGLAEQLTNNEATFAENETLNTAMEQLDQLYQAGYFGENTLSDANSDTAKMLAEGTYAMSLANLTTPATIEADYGVSADTFGFFPIPLNDNQLSPAHPAGPSKFVYSQGENIDAAKDYLAWLAEPEQLQYLLDNTTDFASLSFSGLEEKWDANQQAYLDAYPTETIVYQDAVTYVNPQWMDMGKDMVSMFTGQMSANDVLVSIDQRRSEMAMTAGDPAWQ